ncbi:Uncharacterised protein [Salmonella enterica subsp. enterica serovar Typhi]|nr:Uncharacterised protein [Salmonella enterica subsp. enterica serovar Typhi]CGZ73916.1 Uncharacterised protein [Salmonella enterica subsp. enterica serovar Typhi]CHD24843.1 Uncharacterised protein [Salmonella enterica subsp. enterica serovar Typhi]CHL89154.1 Uncharacterised protein [Salmonella enterica subsp. enterica serovar Typhi]
MGRDTDVIRQILGFVNYIVMAFNLIRAELSDFGYVYIVIIPAKPSSATLSEQRTKVVNFADQRYTKSF